MISGRYRQGREALPRVIHISIARYHRRLPRSNDPLEFLVSIHEEGTAITWQRNAYVNADTEREFLDTTQELYLWSQNLALTPEKARDRVKRLGNQLYETFVGAAGEKYLQTVAPTAVLLDVDETILNLPWELLAHAGEALSLNYPFGRLVTTRIVPRPGRDPVKEDNTVRILTVANPTLDLASSEGEVRALRELEGHHGEFDVEVRVIEREQATRARFGEMLSIGNYDIIHFAGHGSLDPAKPERSALHFADGVLTADDVLTLSWPAPPYFVFNSACESGRAAGGRRLLSRRNQTNGLAAAFLAAGVAAYAGYFWPVTEVGAGTVASTFYRSMFERENVGLAFLEARAAAVRELYGMGDLTGYSAILFGDAASAHRRDVAMSV